jgi:hypothetical protein
MLTGLHVCQEQAHGKEPTGIKKKLTFQLGQATAAMK